MKKAIPLLVLLSMALAGCGFLPERISRDDPRLEPMLEAMARADRGGYGFTPLGRDSTIRLELGPRHGYDVMLHIDGKTSRTIAFKSHGSGYEWVGEQETFEGPRKYKTVDGEFQEAITLTYDTVRISGFPINQLSVSYRGEDPVLGSRRELALQDVRPVLKRWGY